MCLLTNRGRCRTDTREPGKAHQHGGCIFPTSDFGFSVFLSGSKNFTVTNINSVVFPLFSGHVQAAQLSHVAACFSRQDLFDLVSFPTSRQLLVCQQWGAETTLVCRCVFAVFLRVQRIIADVSCVRRHHAARSASAPGASVRFVHNGGPRPFLHKLLENSFVTRSNHFQTRCCSFYGGIRLLQVNLAECNVKIYKMEL